MIINIDRDTSGKFCNYLDLTFVHCITTNDHALQIRFMVGKEIISPRTDKEHYYRIKRDIEYYIVKTNKKRIPEMYGD